MDECSTCSFAATSLGAKKILQMDAVSISDAIEKKKLTCQDLMKATLDRIDEVNPRCNAIIQVRNRAELLALARRADQSARKGWLHGIPIAIKDLSNAKGLPTTFGGSPLFQDFVPNFNDTFVENIEKAGGIIIGKTNTPENGLGSHTFNNRWGTTVNPFDTSKSAGGSSGGAAVAVATRMLCLADGSDMMGSLRNPAGWNCLYSHRPTAGMIPGAPPTQKNPLPYPISTPGPIARTPMDCAFLLETMAGKTKFSASKVLMDDSVESMRIGWLGDWGGEIPFEDGIISKCRGALDVLKQDGLFVDDLANEPIFPRSLLWDSWKSIRFATVAFNYTQEFDAEVLLSDASSIEIREELRWEIGEGQKVTEADLSQASQVHKMYSESLNGIFSKYDFLALPSAQLWPFPADWKWPKTVGGITMDTYHRWMEICVPVSFGGLPCSTIPAGFGENGLPIGVQIFAKRDDDVKLLRLANAFHKKTNWPSCSLLSETSNSIMCYEAQ